ncbi:MAG TPA: dual specificity protein phosphatase family protein, partial [Candidatus Acidoferrales bacterium]|nr:dual specificity protein phosphatase family protein [Candidatus Acidoferrales bacterium]
MNHGKILAAVALLSALVFFSLSLGSRFRSASSSETLSANFPVTRIQLVGVPNGGEITPLLYRGAQPTPDGFHSLAASGVAIDVDLRDEGDRDAEREAVTREGMQYVGIPWQCQHPSDSITARFLEVVRDNPDKKIFVHCHQGIDRTGLMIAAFRMADQNWTANEARREMIAYGFDSLHRSWCSAVDSYEQSFPLHFSSAPEFESL